MEENSKKMKSGLEKAPHRSLLYALGLTREEMERPLVGVVNAASEVVPGHLHLGKLAEAVQAKEQGRDARDLRDSVCQRLAAGDEIGHRRGKVKDRTLVVLHV